jgi:hypothetical protein
VPDNSVGVITKKFVLVGGNRRPMESGNYAMVQIAEALAKSGVKLVPDIVAGVGTSGQGGTLVDVLLANVIRDSAARSKT